MAKTLYQYQNTASGMYGVIYGTEWDAIDSLANKLAYKIFNRWHMYHKRKHGPISHYCSTSEVPYLARKILRKMLDKKRYVLRKEIVDSFL